MPTEETTNDILEDIRLALQPTVVKYEIKVPVSWMMWVLLAMAMFALGFAAGSAAEWWDILYYGPMPCAAPPPPADAVQVLSLS